ncbi:MAG: NUDIX domain-containing protein [Acidimicrobiaceae bacterium]|nr:NUDIX domain-containing protein [Acidimicrobiaceae bacterium]
MAPWAGDWALPGGRVERGETLAVAGAGVREVCEETVLTVEPGELVGSHAPAVRWFSLDGLRTLRLGPGFLDFVDIHRTVAG